MSSSTAPFSFLPRRPTGQTAVADEASVLHLDCRAGVAGDMLTGALLHLVDELAGDDDEGRAHAADARAVWRTGLESLGLANVDVTVESVQKRGIGALQLHVGHDEHHPHRGLSDVLKILQCGALSAGALARATEAFTTLATAEAAVHQTTVDAVHFHEVGAVDAIIDIASASILLDMLNPTEVKCTPVRTGFGTVECAHGTMPVPAPATARLLRGIPTFAGDTEKECATPTGVALLKAAVDTFVDDIAFTPWAEGYGAGNMNPAHANVVRATWASAESAVALSVDIDREDIVVVEAHVDDMTGEDFAALTDVLFESGAVDVSMATAIGKKGRPMTWVRVLVPPRRQNAAMNALFTHSTTLGLRVRTETRLARVRDAVAVDTEFGSVSGKRVVDPNGERFFPEADDCAAAAAAHTVSVATVRHAAVAAFARELSSHELARAGC